MRRTFLPENNMAAGLMIYEIINLAEHLAQLLS
jgi:hypothetical protein